MVTLRFKNFKKDGSEETVIWKFEEFSRREGETYVRDEEREAGGRFRRRPYFEQTVLRIGIPAGVLQIPTHAEKFKKLCRAHEVELGTTDAHDKTTWKQFTPDLPNGDMEYEYVEDLDPLRTYTIKLIETEPRDFRGWE